MFKVKKILIALFLSLALLSQFSITALAGPNSIAAPPDAGGGSSGGGGGGGGSGGGDRSDPGPGCSFDAP